MGKHLEIIHSSSYHCSLYQNHLEGLLQHRLLSPNPGVSDSVHLGWDPRICIFNKLLGDADHGNAAL